MTHPADAERDIDNFTRVSSWYSHCKRISVGFYDCADLSVICLVEFNASFSRFIGVCSVIFLVY